MTYQNFHSIKSMLNVILAHEISENMIPKRELSSRKHHDVRIQTSWTQNHSNGLRK